MTGIQVFDGKGVWRPREDVDVKLTLHVGELSQECIVWIHIDRWQHLQKTQAVAFEKIPVFFSEDQKMWWAVNAFWTSLSESSRACQCTHLAGPAENELIEP